MVTRVLSLLRGADAGAARSADPALDANAFAVAEDVELVLVLKDQGVELGVAGTSPTPEEVAGVSLPAASPAGDLTALLASGVRVCALDSDLAARGLRQGDLVDGIDIIDERSLAELMVETDVTLTTTS